ncbi:MAG: hypothetical protein WCY09_09795 [Candidatus Omnitrophota bacterium]|jgi:hypothetical protein
MENKIDLQYSPDIEYKYFLYDPEGDGMTFYKSIEDRDKAAESAIDNMLDDGAWSESVDQILSGEVTHKATMVDKQVPDGKIDPETQEDEAGTYWPGDIDYMCRYKMLPLKGGE